MLSKQIVSSAAGGNSARVSSETRRWRGRLFQRCGPATLKDRCAQTCVRSWNLTRSDVGQSKLSATAGSGKLAVIGQVPRRNAEQQRVTVV